MLLELHITNYALIDKLDVTFHSGLNIITGETGAGKSIMLGALSLIFGGRADSRTARRSDKKSVIECVFDASNCESLREYCSENDFEWMDDNLFILRREISPNGRSRAFINDVPTSVASLGEVALYLVDIHSQHKNMLLAQPRFQLEIIDALAGNAERLNEYSHLFAKLKSAIKQLKSKRAELKKTAENAEFLHFQLEKIKAIDPKPGELAELEASHEQISQAVERKANLEQAVELLNGNDGILDSISTLDGLIADLADTLDGADQLAEQIEKVRIELADISRIISSANSSLSNEMGDLEYIESRIDKLHDLMGRFGVDSDEELAAMRSDIENSLDQLDGAATITKELDAAARAAMAEARTKATEISAARHAAAAEFAKELKLAATPLGMNNLQVDIDLSETDLSSTGFDKANFLFSFNKNQPLTPVAESASGGEISRLMLCIKAIVADRMSLPSILFDEIDTGISGEVAVKMGQMMHRMSSSLQTIVITHLPQVAAAGDHHYKVYKEDDEDATHTHIKELTQAQRIDELTLMLGGEVTSDAARLNAESLLKNNGKI